MRTETFLVPSGASFTIRETTGADDEIMSSQDDSNIVLAKYLAAVIQSIDGVSPVTPEMVNGLLLRDKYVALVKSRIFSLGNLLYFNHSFDPVQPPYEFIQDLNDFVWDYSQPFPYDVTDPLYKEERIAPYKVKVMEKTLTSGKVIKMDCLDGKGEAFLLKLTPARRTINSQLLARNIQLLENGIYTPVRFFGNLSSREMAEIRALYEENDPPTEGLMTIQNPETGQYQRVSILEVRDFFFPVKIS